MKNHAISPLSLLLTLMVLVFAGNVMAQQPNTVQSAAPDLQMPATVAPVNQDPEIGKGEIRSTTSNGIGGSSPVENSLPATQGSVQSAAADIQRPLTSAELEELKDGK